MRRAWFAAAATVALAGCATPPRDSFARAQAAMRRNDLIAALLAYDAVPVADTRYPEACAGAAAVQLRLQRGHELMRAGLELRGERRDREALDRLRQARDVYPGLPGIDGLIAATQDRLQRTARDPLVASRSPEPAPPLALASPSSNAVDEEALSAPADVEAIAAEDPSPTKSALAPADESVVLGLVAVEARLGRGELEQAVVDLLELARRFPDDVRVQLRLARVLHQRALLRYGQGALTAASLDWERVLAIEPDNAEVAELLRAVRLEAAPPAAPR